MAPGTRGPDSRPSNLDLEPIIVKLSDDVLSGRQGIREGLQEAAQQTGVVAEKWHWFLE
jgi:hypothetical protein